MPLLFRPHVLGIDDAPFAKGQSQPVPIVGVTMEGQDLVEAVAIGEFPVDGSGATQYLADWITGLRSRPMLQGVMLGGITIAGLGLVDIPSLSERLGLPILVVTRHNPDNAELRQALKTVGLLDRLPILDRTPRAYRVAEGLFLAHAGGTRVEAEKTVCATLAKARLPEPLRIAHLIGRAIVMRESRGRV